MQLLFIDLVSRVTRVEIAQVIKWRRAIARYLADFTEQPMSSTFFVTSFAAALTAATFFFAASGDAQTRRPAQNAAPATTTQTPEQELLSSGPPETLSQCMSYWDPSTQMSKSEWRDTCQRTQNGLNPLGTSEQPIRDTTKKR